VCNKILKILSGISLKKYVSAFFFFFSVTVTPKGMGARLKAPNLARTSKTLPLRPL
jgi:hypothetical protein